MTTEPRFLVRGYDRQMRVLGETEHVDYPSAAAEVTAWLRRINDRKDPAASCEIVCLQIKTTMTAKTFLDAFQWGRRRASDQAVARGSPLKA